MVVGTAMGGEEKRMQWRCSGSAEFPDRDVTFLLSLFRFNLPFHFTNEFNHRINPLTVTDY